MGSAGLLIGSLTTLSFRVVITEPVCGVLNEIAKHALAWFVGIVSGLVVVAFKSGSESVGLIEVVDWGLVARIVGCWWLWIGRHR